MGKWLLIAIQDFILLYFLNVNIKKNNLHLISPHTVNIPLNVGVYYIHREYGSFLQRYFIILYFLKPLI